MKAEIKRFKNNWNEKLPFNSWHSQIDNQSFGFYAYGRDFMIDSGSYIYESDDPEEKKWREWFRSSVENKFVFMQATINRPYYYLCYLEDHEKHGEQQ